MAADVIMNKVGLTLEELERTPDQLVAAPYSSVAESYDHLRSEAEQQLVS